MTGAHDEHADPGTITRRFKTLAAAAGLPEIVIVPTSA